MKKRIFGILLAMLMIVSVLPVTAFAGVEAVYSVWVSGIQVTESNAADVLGEADGSAKTVVFDPATNTLTLSGATIAATGSASGFGYDAECVRAVKSELDKLTVHLVGTTQIGKEVTAESSLGDYSVDIGVSCTGNVVFTGAADSSLIIYDYAAGIVAKNVVFGEDFKGKLTVRDCGGPEPQPPCTINAIGIFDDATMDYIGDGTVSILGGTFDLVSFMSNGIATDGDITVKNAGLTINADNTGIESGHGSVTVVNTDLNVTADTGIDADGDVLIDNGNVKIVVDGAEGIDGGRNVTIQNCPTVDIAGADEALMVKKTVSIINCPDVKMSSPEISVISSGDILIENSTVAMIAENGNNGLVAMADEDGDGNITIKDSKVTIQAEGNGIKCNRLSVSGGKTEVYSAGDVDLNGIGCGAYIMGDESALSITGATVKLTGGEASIKFEKESEADPFTGSLPVEFSGNTAFDTFDPLQNVTYKSEKNPAGGAFCEMPYIGDAIAKSVAVLHTHTIVKVDGVPATTKNAGYRSYYRCDCGKNFEDEQGNAEIADIEQWKAEGGNGYLSKIAEPEPEPEPKSPPTGETTNVMPWFILLAVSFAGLAFGRKRKSAE